MLQKSPTLTPSLKNLSYILRHRELWPDGFRWNYNYTSTCAIGLCDRLWGINPVSLHEDLRDSELTYAAAPAYYGIFTRGYWMFFGGNRVTPELVAKRIDRFLGKSHVQVW